MQVTNIRLVDFNADGKLDLACIVGDDVLVFLGTGNGTFNSGLSFFAGSAPNSLVTGDFDGDTKVDIAAAGPAGLALLVGKGDGTFLPAAFSFPMITGLFSTADLNGDGALDLLAIFVTSTNSTGEAVFLGNGDVTFQAPLPLPLNPFQAIAGVADVNGDGKLDLLTTPSLQVLLGNGDGSFADPTLILPGFTNFSGLSQVVSLAADFNRDGRPDVLLVGNSANLSAVATVLNTTLSPPSDFLINASRLSPALLAPGNSGTSTVTLTSIGGFSSGVALSCTGLPTGASCSFAPSSLADSSSTSLLTIATAGSTPVGTYPLSVVGTSSAIIHQRLMTLTVATTKGATTASLAPQTVTFAQQANGTTSNARSITTANTGAVPLAISNISITGTNAGDFSQSNTCGSTLAVGANCQISVKFTPTVNRTRIAAISVNDNATGSPQMVGLQGMGPDFSLLFGSTTATAMPGQTANYTITVSPSAGFDQLVALNCSGAPALSTCMISPNSVAAGGASATASVTVTTTARSHGLSGPFGPDTPELKYRPSPLVVVLLALGFLVSLITCGRLRGTAW